jgi:hypothetical protein
MCVTIDGLNDAEKEIKEFLNYFDLETSGKSGSILYTALEQKEFEIDKDKYNKKTNTYDNAEDTSTFDSYKYIEKWKNYKK